MTDEELLRFFEQRIDELHKKRERLVRVDRLFEHTLILNELLYTQILKRNNQEYSENTLQ